MIVDDHEIVRRGVRSLLLNQTTYDICGEAVDGQDALEKARELRPDLIIMDVGMPRLNGLEATRQVRSMLPDCEVLILSQHENSEMAHQALRAGARGYVVKSSISRDLISAIANASRREYFFDPAILKQTPSIDSGVQEILQRSAAYEKALKESEQRLRKLADYQSAVMNNMAEGLYVLDANGLLTSINRAAEAILGWSKDELIGKEMHDITHYKRPDGSPYPARECPGMQVVQNGMALREYEDTFLRKDGSFVPVVFSASPLKEEGKIAGVIVSFRDDTEKRRVREALLDAKQELEKSQEQLALALQSSRTAIFEWDIVERRGHWNSQMAALYEFDLPRAWMTADEWMDLFHPDDRERLAKEAERVWKEDKEFTFEFRTVRRDGEIRWMLSHGRILRDGEGRALRMLGVHADITAQKRAEFVLAEKARQQRALFLLTDDLHRADSMEEVYSAALTAILNSLQCDRAAILFRDQAGVMRFKKWSGLWHEYRAAADGYSPWKPDGRNPQPVCVSDVDTADLPEFLKLNLKKECIDAVAFVPLMVNGKLEGEFAVYFNTPHAFCEGEIELGFTIARQIAFAIDRLQGIEELRRNQDRLRALADKLDSEVLIRTSQLEARNAEVLRYSEQLRELSQRSLQDLDNERRRIARELHDSAGQMLTALGMKLAAITQMSKEDAQLEEEIEDSQRLIQQISEEIRTMSYLLHPPLLDETGLPEALRWYVRGLNTRSSLQIHLEIDDDLERLPSEMELAIFRIVQEALTNIHRHSGSENAFISMRQGQENVRLEIRDEGKGISPEKLAEIWPYGSGVGIGGMRERVRQFKGEMEIQSGDGGTKIQFMIPAPASARKVEKELGASRTAG